MAAFRVGIGRVDITPTPGTPQGGWGAQTHQRGLGADMPFFATAIALENDGELALIVEADAIGFDPEWTLKILTAISLETQVPLTHIRFSCSHTHSGPNTFRLDAISEGLELVLSYLQSLPDLIAGAAWQACRNFRPARMAAGVGECDININRRCVAPDGRRVSGFNEDGVADKTVRVIRFDDLSQNPIAVIVHYACHPTIMAWQNQWFTPDYPGMMRSTVEQQLGAKCLFLQGAAGDIGPRAGYTGDLRKYRRAGQILGLEAAKAAVSLDTVPVKQTLSGVLQSGAPIALYYEEVEEVNPPRLRVTHRNIALPTRKLQPANELAAEAERLKSELFELRSQNAPTEEIRAATARSTQANWRANMAKLYGDKDTTEWPIQCISVGPLAFISTAGEPFTETARKIVKGSPFEHTLFSGYSNGGFGYIPTRIAFEEGGYEVDASPFSPEAADLLAEECLKLLREHADFAAEPLERTTVTVASL